MSKYKIIWIVVFVQWFLSMIAIHKDVSKPIEILLVSLWCTGGAILLAALFQAYNKNKKVQMAVLWAFILTSMVSIFLLCLLAITTITNDSLNESAIGFIVFPFVYLKFGVIGAVMGLLLYYIRGKLSN